MAAHPAACTIKAQASSGMVMAKFICHKGDEHTLTKARNILFYLDTSYTWNVNEGMKDGAQKKCLGGHTKGYYKKGLLGYEHRPVELP